jgi:two-component system chemotaxis sensor kinase CheA
MVERALLCSWGEFQIAVPLISVAHISSCDQVQTNIVNGMRYCQFNNLTVPLMTYSEFLGLNMQIDQEKLRKSSAVYIRVEDRFIALLVDKVEAQTDLVVKGFGEIVHDQRGFKGISILADEKVTYVVDPDRLLSLIQLNEVEREAA